jgi:hypothetical protein
MIHVVVTKRLMVHFFTSAGLPLSCTTYWGFMKQSEPQVLCTDCTALLRNLELSAVLSDIGEHCTATCAVRFILSSRVKPRWGRSGTRGVSRWAAGRNAGRYDRLSLRAALFFAQSVKLHSHYRPVAWHHLSQLQQLTYHLSRTSRTATRRLTHGPYCQLLPALQLLTSCTVHTAPKPTSELSNILKTNTDKINVNSI